MPRNVRNFWFEAEVDGKKKKLASGPVNKDGGICIRLLVRNKGEVAEAGHIHGYVDSRTGMLRLDLDTSGNETGRPSERVVIAETPR